MIRARALFGKRPGRMRAELANKGTSHPQMCNGCKGLYDPNEPENVFRAGEIDLIISSHDQSFPLCFDCRTYNDKWFAHLTHMERSTPKDSRGKLLLPTRKSE